MCTFLNTIYFSIARTNLYAISSYGHVLDIHITGIYYCITNGTTYIQKDKLELVMFKLRLKSTSNQQAIKKKFKKDNHHLEIGKFMRSYSPNKIIMYVKFIKNPNDKENINI